MRKNLISAAIHRLLQSRQKLPEPEQFEMLSGRLQNKVSTLSKIAVSTPDGYELIPADQIMICEAHDNYTHLLLKSKKKIIASRTLKEIEEQLQDFSNFVRVHHLIWLISLNEVTKYVRGEGGHLIMSDHSTVAVSRSRKEALLKWF